ncbi:MAG: endonuclease/exonuclease/phosphatase family protein, partial [Parafilimonas sp.]
MASASIKNIFIKIWFIACIILSLSYLLASASAFIPPESFSPITFFGFAFPIFLICQLIFCIIAFFIQRKLAFVMILIIPFGYYNFGNTVALHSKQWQPVKKDSSLRIMTWNVESFVDLSEQSYPKSAARVQMLKLIQQYDPDVLCLQEYKSVEGGKRRISAQKELDSIGYKYHFCSNDVVIKTNKRVVSGGVAFFSKLPL